jgi:hypothetical protein
MCGATSGQKAVAGQQQGIFQTITNQAQQVFGAASKVFNDLVSTFSPIVQAGPNQEGLSPAAKAAMQSKAITTVGNQYKNASQAVKEANAAMGGGNMALPSGAEIGSNVTLAGAAAGETAKELNDIEETNYQIGHQNWVTATRGLAEAPGVFAPAMSASGLAVNAGGK